MLTFRRISDEECEAVAEMVGAEADEIRRSACDDGVISLVAVDGGVVGYAAFEVRGAEAFVRDIFVSEPVRRGRIGTMMYRMAERACRQRGAVILHLGGREVGGDAESFFQSMGFSGAEKDITVERFDRECGGSAARSNE